MRVVESVREKRDRWLRNDRRDCWWVRAWKWNTSEGRGGLICYDMDGWYKTLQNCSEVLVDLFMRKTRSYDDSDIEARNE